jgi:ribosome-binding protein aMBF1 (putative translation factor)
MALFFDAAWFDAKLASAHLSRGDLAQALGLTDAQIVEMWKDQRELSAQQVSVMAGLLGVHAREIAERAGISTPVPREGITLSDLAMRLTRMEHEIAEMKTMLRALKGGR